MSRKGEIVVVCDIKGCNGEHLIHSWDVNVQTLATAIQREGWRRDSDGRDVCPSCVEKVKG